MMRADEQTETTEANAIHRCRDSIFENEESHDSRQAARLPSAQPDVATPAKNFFRTKKMATPDPK
jgi:hypothetical protein